MQSDSIAGIRFTRPLHREKNCLLIKYNYVVIKKVSLNLIFFRMEKSRYVKKPQNAPRFFIKEVLFD